jgi:hypothetical protein
MYTHTLTHYAQATTRGLTEWRDCSSIPSLTGWCLPNCFHGETYWREGWSEEGVEGRSSTGDKTKGGGR